MSSVSWSSNLSDRCPFYGTIHGHYFHPPSLPRSPPWMCRKSQKIKHYVSVFTCLPPPVPQAHSDSASTAPGRTVCQSSSGMQSGRTALVWEGHPLSISGRRFGEERQTRIISMLPTDSLIQSSLGTPFRLFRWHTHFYICVTIVLSLFYLELLEGGDFIFDMCPHYLRHVNVSYVHSRNTWIPTCLYYRKELHDKMSPLPLYQSGFNPENRSRAENTPPLEGLGR